MTLSEGLPCLERQCLHPTMRVLECRHVSPASSLCVLFRVPQTRRIHEFSKCTDYVASSVQALRINP